MTINFRDTPLSFPQSPLVGVIATLFPLPPLVKLWVGAVAALGVGKHAPTVAVPGRISNHIVARY